MAKAGHSEGQDMDIEKVRELVKLVEESGIEELEVSHLDTTIRIQKSSGPVAAGQMMMPAHLMPQHQMAPAPATAQVAAPAAPEVDVARAKWKDVRSPIVGTFYRSPSPSSPMFVNSGDHVQVGQTLCIIEAMKVMNEIEAEFAGTIREVLAEDGGPVEAEAVLFLVEPD